jgi:hypothetical protein
MIAILDRSRLTGRLFYCLISLLLAVCPAHGSSPATTTVSDIVYRGDGTPASGTLLISWPEFSSADGYAVAAGSMSLTIGAGGAISVALVPNAGGTPAGTYYKVVYKLDFGATSTEYWSVPATSPTTIAAIRATEALFGHNSSADKKSSALSFANAAIGVADAVAGKQIVDSAKFNEGLGKVIDGVVECLNASVWSKTK